MLVILIIFAIITPRCIQEFIPKVDENKELLVVEAMITDQNRTNSVRLSKSMPLGKLLIRKPVRSANVTVIDDYGNATVFKETEPGLYISDSAEFRGHVGRKYALRIESEGLFYSSDFVEMKPVPPIDSVYWEKVLINPSDIPGRVVEGCKIYVDTHDPDKKCLYYRWEFVETWEFRLLYPGINTTCWISEKSKKILVKNTSIYNQARVSKFPLTFITNETDRLQVRYSILVKQYSMSAGEYTFWDKVQNISENVGSLYDITPMTIRGNIRCESQPDEFVLGYFSVSAVSEERIFIRDRFKGIPNFYKYCPSDTIRNALPTEGRNINWWVIEDHSGPPGNYWLITLHRECVDCTTRGTNIKPSYWPDDIY